MKAIPLYLIFCLSFRLLSAATYTVTTTADSGPGSLREAITLANASSGGDQILFNVPLSDSGYNPATGVFTITLSSSLPMITGALINIDATSQAINQGNTNLSGPEIRLVPNGIVSYPLILVSPGNTVKGFIIAGFEYGILIYNGTSFNNTITENYIGINHNATLADANQYGVGIGGSAYGNTVSNNVISGNSQAGIAITESGSNTIKGNIIGANATGETAIPNLYGIALQNASNNQIGGTGAQDKNLISGNTFAGIVADGLQTTNLNIIGNIIGTTLSGTDTLPNENGIILSYASSCVIGGNSALHRNIISGNTGAGIVLNGTGTRLNTIKGNYIGTDVSGLIPLSNYAGIVLKSNSNSNVIGGMSAFERNIISANIEMGVYIEAADSNIIIGNYIGPDASGMDAFKIGDTLLQANGIELNTVAKHNRIGGYSSEERNIISGNRVYGMVYYGNTSYNPVIGNYIGVDVTGNNPLPNATGICVDGGSHHNQIIGNVLSGNISYGIFVVTNQTFYNEVKGNLVGTNAAGTDSVPNDAGVLLGGGARNNIIGGDLPEDRNIISGNRYGGIEVSDQLTRENRIAGNYIGTDITGTYPIPNQYGIGVTSNPRKNTFDNNLISGNKNFGLLLFEFADSNIVTRNLIGTASDGESALGNGTAGIVIWGGSSGNSIGGIDMGNTIAFHDSVGVFILDANTKRNTISANSLFQNNHMGIDLSPEGPNYNDGGDTDDGPNELINHPVIQHAAKDPASQYFWAYGNIDTQQPSGTIIELFVSDGNPYDRGEGKTYIGQAVSDPTGLWAFWGTGAETGELITATATDVNGNTSEFSPNFIVLTSVEEYNQSQFLTVFPNPAAEYVVITGKTPFQVVNVYDMKGVAIGYRAEEHSENTRLITFSQHLAAGQYFIYCLTENGLMMTTMFTKM